MASAETRFRLALELAIEGGRTEDGTRARIDRVVSYVLRAASRTRWVASVEVLEVGPQLSVEELSVRG